MPGIAAIGSRRSSPWATNIGVDEIARCELGLADEAPERAGGAQPTQASLRERHGPDPEYPTGP